MDKKTLLKEIRKNYDKGNYQKTLLNICDYLNYKDAFVFDELLTIYLNCQIELKYFDEAFKTVKVMHKLFPNSFTKFKVMLKCIELNQMSSFLTFLKTYKFTEEEYYYMARKCFYYELYDIAKILLNHTINVSTNPIIASKSKKMLTLINLYNQNKDVFHMMEYAHFQRKNLSLKPGHIIYTKRTCKTNSSKKLEPSLEKVDKPFVIWEIKENKIYAFPIENVNTIDKFTFPNNKYPNMHSNFKIVNELTCIDSKYIDKVIEQINVDNLNTIIYNIYFKTMTKDSEYQEKRMLFIKEMQKKLKQD